MSGVVCKAAELQDGCFCLLLTRSGLSGAEFTTGQLAVSVVEAYPQRMCRNITRDQLIEGWRATVGLLPVFRPFPVVVMAAALVAWLHRNIQNFGSSKTTAHSR